MQSANEFTLPSKTIIGCYARPVTYAPYVGGLEHYTTTALDVRLVHGKMVVYKGADEWASSLNSVAL